MIFRKKNHFVSNGLVTRKNKQNKHFEIYVNQEAVILFGNIKKREEIKHIKMHTLSIVIAPEKKDPLMPVFHKRNLPSFMNLECSFSVMY